MDLKEDYLDDILDTSVNEKRKYRMINNADGTISLEDVTEYSQNGDNFGASDINITNKTVNELIAMGLNVRCNSEGYLEVLVDGEWEQSILEVLPVGEKLLFSYGSEYETVTGGWETFNYGSSGTSQKQSDCFYIGSNDLNNLGGFVTAIKIDVSRYTTCDVTCQPNEYQSTSSPFVLGFSDSNVAINSNPTANNFSATYVEAMTSSSKVTQSFDISTLNGEFYIIVCLRQNHSKIFEIKLK